jgi:hypothetical protein
MTKTTLDRRVLLTSEQKAEAADLRAMGFTQAWRRVLTPEQRQVFYEQIRAAERLRYIENPYGEIIKRARNLGTARANALPNTTLGSSRSRRMTWTGRRTAPCCRGSNFTIQAITDTIQLVHH